MHVQQGQKCVVVGLGTSGMAAVRFLHGLGAQVSVSESRNSEELDRADLIQLQELGVDLECGGHTVSFFESAELVIPSPGVPLDLPVICAARKRGVPVAGELALAAGKIKAPVIGVTGSNGKTTVTSLIGHLLEAAGKEVFVGGNIGTPVLDYICGPQRAQAVVLELSSFQLEIGDSFRPDIGLLLNISPDHLDRHGSMDSYAGAKRMIFAYQGRDDTALLGADDPLVMAGQVQTAGTVLRFGLQADCEARVTAEGVVLSAVISGHRVDEQYDLQATGLDSNINRLNAAAAILAVRVLGCESEAVRAGLETYEVPAHRMTPVAQINGVSYVDDSKGTNIGAVTAALISSGGRVILIAGGRDKGSDFSQLQPTISKYVKQLILIGEAAEQMEQQLGAFAPAARAASMEEAVCRAAEIARPGDTVLLSPGCASFDMFDGYAQRGDVYQEAVLGLNIKQQSRCQKVRS